MSAGDHNKSTRVGVGFIEKHLDCRNEILIVRKI